MVQDEPAEELLDGGVLGVLLDEDGGGVVPPPASQAVAFSASCASVPSGSATSRCLDLSLTAVAAPGAR